MPGTRKVHAHTGKEGLFRLVEMAHIKYSEEVATRLKSYRRFALDFLNSTRFHDDTDAWSKNEHLKNYRTIEDILTNHEKMARRYFDCEAFNEQVIADFLNEFYALDLPELKASGYIPEDIPNGLCNNTSPLFDDYTLGLIVRLANEAILFTEALDIEETARRYRNQELKRVVSSNNTRLVLVLDRLALYNIIPYNWQSLIERNRLVLSSTGKKCLDSHDMASALSRVKDAPLSPQNKKALSIADLYIQQILDRQDDRHLW